MSEASRHERVRVTMNNLHNQPLTLFQEIMNESDNGTVENYEFDSAWDSLLNRYERYYPTFDDDQRRAMTGRDLYNTGWRVISNGLEFAAVHLNTCALSAVNDNYCAPCA